MHSNPSLLVIDDDLGLQESLKLSLELEGFSIVGAKSAEEGLEILSDGAKPKPNLILLDLMMPGIGGFGFLERLESQPKNLSEIPVIVLTAADKSFLSDPRINIAKSVITKPFDIDELLKQISQSTHEEQTAG